MQPPHGAASVWGNITGHLLYARHCGLMRGWLCPCLGGNRPEKGILLKGILGTLGEVGEVSGHVSLPDPRGGLESGQVCPQSLRGGGGAWKLPGPSSWIVSTDFMPLLVEIWCGGTQLHPRWSLYVLRGGEQGLSFAGGIPTT